MSETPSSFPATRWTLAIQARGDNDAGRAALSELCAAYYTPVVAFIRSGGRQEDAARELAHGFFAKVLAGHSLQGADPARGRFRSYLLGAVKHFLRDAYAKQHAEKRGGGIENVPLGDTSSGLGVADAGQQTAEQAFDRQWALTVISRALALCQEELGAAGKSSHFEVLKPWINGPGTGLSQSTAAAALGMSEGAVKVAIHRLRQRFRDAVKAEIAQTIAPEDDADEELRHLIAVLARG